MGQTFNFSEETNIKLDYINIPVLAKYYFNESLSLHAGPQIGFLISAEEEYEYSESGGGQSVSESETIDAKDFYSSIDLGLALGAEYELDMGVFFGARYTLGLSNIIDTEEDDFSVQNNVIQVSVGYKF